MTAPSGEEEPNAGDAPKAGVPGGFATPNEDEPNAEDTFVVPNPLNAGVPAGLAPHVDPLLSSSPKALGGARNDEGADVE